jgi:SAM-dependent methyltransferase
LAQTNKKQAKQNPAALPGSLLDYYQQNRFNPVPIALENQAAWESHRAKRLNLYQRHLGIPLAMLRDRSVLEFGCNSGENSLVLASFGANLTLVEPNDQVLPQLKMRFKEFKLEGRIVELSSESIDSFKSTRLYDIVLAEGFLYTLPNRDEMFKKICKLLIPGGLAVISFNDRYGCLLELTKRLLLWRACQLAGINDVHSEASLHLAQQLFGEDFAKLNASRPFYAWWKDVLVNPLLVSAYLWSYPELLSLVEKAGCEFYSSSPMWNLSEHYNWYKNVFDTRSRHGQLLKEWSRSFPFFLTGFPVSSAEGEPATNEVVAAIAEVIAQISEYTTAAGRSINPVSYPSALDDYLGKSRDSRVRRFNIEMKGLFQAARSSQLQDLISTYHRTKHVRNLWGTPYHYLCINKLPSSVAPLEI